MMPHRDAPMLCLSLSVSLVYGQPMMPRRDALLLCFYRLVSLVDRRWLPLLKQRCDAAVARALQLRGLRLQLFLRRWL